MVSLDAQLLLDAVVPAAFAVVAAESIRLVISKRFDVASFCVARNLDRSTAPGRRTPSLESKSAT